MSVVNDQLFTPLLAYVSILNTLSSYERQNGAASYVQVLSAEQSYQTAAVALVKARAQRYADTAALFQALGGGWWNRHDVAANSIE